MTWYESWRLILKSFEKLDKALTEIESFEIFNANASDETEICPLILSGRF